MTDSYPTGLEREGDQALRITWNDGSVRRYTLQELRDACPCATCREKKSGRSAKPHALPIVTPAQMQPLQIAQMKPVGSYAYSIVFSDGHDTGIYTLELLKQLGQPVE
jgi:DUF971 family protein